MRLRERLEIRELADGVYHAHAGEQYQLQVLADVHGEDARVAWPVHGAAPITLNMRADR